jgi:HK97 family phage major capsid protein
MGDVPRLSDLPRVSVGPKPTLGLVKLAIASTVAKGDPVHALAIAQSRFPRDENLHAVLKSAITAGQTSGTWGATLWQYQNMVEEFTAALKPLSIIGRLQGYRPVPFMMRAARSTQSATIGWVGQGLPKSVSEMLFDEVQLGRSKCAGICVISSELARSSDPSAERTIQQDMLASVSKFVDEQFISPSNVASVGVHPGSILSGVSGITSSGTSAANIVTDLTAAVAALLSGGSSLLAPTWIMHPRTAVAIALKRDSQNGPAFPGFGINGGLLCGVPSIISGNVPWSSSGGGVVVLLDQAEVLLADGTVTVDGSNETSLQMDSAPSSSAANQISMWQSNLFAIRAEKEINWAPRHSAASTAAWIDAAAY